MAVLFAFIALMSVPVLFMDEEPTVEQVCRYLQLFWVLSLGCVVIFWYKDRQENIKIKVVPKIQNIQLI